MSPPPCSFSWFYFSAQCHMAQAFGQSGSAFLAVSPPSFSCTLSLLAGRIAQKAEESLIHCNHCSPATKHSYVIKTVFNINPKHSTIPYNEENYLYSSQKQYRKRSFLCWHRSLGKQTDYFTWKDGIFNCRKRYSEHFALTWFIALGIILKHTINK